MPAIYKPRSEEIHLYGTFTGCSFAQNATKSKIKDRNSLQLNLLGVRIVTKVKNGVFTLNMRQLALTALAI